MEIKKFWPQHLKETIRFHNQFYGQHDRIQTLNDLHDIYAMTPEDIPLFNEVYKVMNDRYNNPHPTDLATVEQMTADYKSGIYDHCSLYLHIENAACLEFLTKFPALYKTMIVWVWG